MQKKKNCFINTKTVRFSLIPTSMIKRHVEFSFRPYLSRWNNSINVDVETFSMAV